EESVRSRRLAVVFALVLLAAALFGAWRLRESRRPVVIEVGSDVSTLAFSADGESLVAGSGVGSDVAWIASVGASQWSRELQLTRTERPRQLAFLPREGLIVGATRGFAELWSARDGTVVPSMLTRSEPGTISEDGTLLATFDPASGVRIWSVP